MKSKTSLLTVALVGTAFALGALSGGEQDRKISDKAAKSVPAAIRTCSRRKLGR